MNSDSVHPPEIQPVGNSPPGPDVMTALKNPETDYTASKQISVNTKPHNYVVVRGHSTLSGIVVQSRLWLANSQAMLNPAVYSLYSTPAKDANGQPTVRQMITA